MKKAATPFSLAALATVALLAPLVGGVASAHESTLAGYETTVAQGAQGEPAVVPPQPGAAQCRLAIKLVDADAEKPLAGLVHLTARDGRALALPGLISRGARLARNHPAAQWHALSGPVAVPVPQAALRVEAFSSLHTEMASRELDLSGRDTAEVVLRLNRFPDSGRRGWHSGNTHLHLRGMTRPQADDYLRALCAADGLELVFVSYLERLAADRDYISNTYTRRELERLGGHGVAFGWGEEHRHNFGPGGEGYGHVMFLDLQRLVRPVSIGPGITGAPHDSPPLRRGIEQAHRNRAAVLWCHNSFGFEDVPDWLDGLLDAQNIFDGGSRGNYDETFYRYLNLGMRVPFSTGTDWFLYDFARVYARPAGAMSVRNWLAALSAGRSFITNGPLLELRADGREIGDTLQLARPRTVTMKGRAVGRHDFRKVELVCNGRVVESAASRAVGGHFEADLNSALRVTEPCWVAFRVAGDYGAGSAPSRPANSGGPRNEMGELLFAHTSPIYIELAGRRVFKPEAAAALITDLEQAVRAIEEQAKFADERQREEVLEIYRKGVERLRQRLATERAPAQR